MKTVLYLFSIFLLTSSCSSEFASPSSNEIDVIKTLWEYIDENYVYFDYKSIDWDPVEQKFLTKINAETSKDSLFTLCTEMIDVMEDGHNFLNTGDSIYSYDYTAGFEVNFSGALIKSKYLKSDFEIAGPFTYGLINDSIGYVYVEKFNRAALFNNVMQFFTTQEVDKIIIDVRNNSGGLPQTAQTMVGYFIDEPTLIGYITHKDGKAQNEFSNKLEVIAMPQSIYFDKKVNILINRKSFSASSYFASMTSYLPNVKLIGQITGGGGGSAAAYELPNGWVVGITSNFFLDSRDNHIENGVAPSIEIENSVLDISMQVDKMLETAIAN